jgi:hypothetical protein
MSQLERRVEQLEKITYKRVQLVRRVFSDEEAAIARAEIGEGLIIYRSIIKPVGE